MVTDPMQAPGADQPVNGSSPISEPSANAGMEAAGMARLNLVVRQLEETIPMLGASTEAGQAALKALSSLSRLVPPGSGSSGVDRTAMEGMLTQHLQMQPQIAALRAQMSGAQPA